jgi:hypothetical protein
MSPQLLTSTIVGVDFFINTFVIINSPERCALFKVDGKTMRQLFDVAEDDSATISCDLASGYMERDVYWVSILPIETSGSSPIDFTAGEEHCAVIGEASIVVANEGSTSCRKGHAECYNVITHCNE